MQLKRYLTPHNRFFIRGVPDISGVLPDGRALFIEVKAPKGRASPEQVVFLDNANKRLAVAFVARSVTDVWLRLKDHVPPSDKVNLALKRWQQIEEFENE